MNDRINEQNMEDANSLRTLEEIKIEFENGSFDDLATNCIGGNQNYVTQTQTTTEEINDTISTGDIEQSSKNNRDEEFEVLMDKRNNANKSTVGNGKNRRKSLRSKANRKKDSIPDRRNDLQNNVAFQCDTRGESFLRKFKLIMHEKNHTGEKPFE